MQEYKRQIAYLYAYERGGTAPQYRFCKGRRTGRTLQAGTASSRIIAIRVKPPEMFIFIFIIRTEP